MISDEIANMSRFVLLNLFWIFACTCTANIVQNVTVFTKYGTVIGKRYKETYQLGNEKATDSVDVFMGIPYAKPPVKDLRFKPPRPPTKWDDPLDAQKPGSVCPQKTYYSQTETEFQSEDCLNLNIYSPVQVSDEGRRYPVMVYIHGGSYEEGAGSRYNGQALAQYGVVVVTINYRLGLLGYLTNGLSTLPGNYGLLDQIEALRWISENIGQFRGDSCNVTLFGNSAGSSSIGLLLLSPHSRGLFHRVIMQSGSPLAFWAVYNRTVDHEAFFTNVTDVLGCHNETTQERVDCLQHIPFANVVENYPNFTRITPSTAIFKPYVDGDILPDYPEPLFRAGLYHNVTVMIGNVQDEWTRSMGWFFHELEGVDKNFSDGFDRISFERSIHYVIEQRLWWPKQVANAAIFQYTSWPLNTSDPFINRDNYAALMSDLVMVAASVQLVNIMSRHGTKIYQYNFNHTSTRTEHDWFRCYHTFELDSVFGSPFHGYNLEVDGLANHTEDDRAVSVTTMTLWTNFAKHGEPTPQPFNGVVWTPVDNSTNNYLHISRDAVEIRHHLRAERMAFWNYLVVTWLGADSEEDPELSKARPADMKLTLMWFFGILTFLTFFVMIALIIRNNKIKKKLMKAVALTRSQQPL